MSRVRHLLPLLVPLVAVSCKPAADHSTKPMGSNPSKPSKPAVKPATPVAQKPADVPTFERPPIVRGIYLTAWSAGSKKKLGKMLGLLDRTALNSVVIDVRDDGEVYFPTKIPFVDKTQGKKYLGVANPKAMMAMLKAHNVYPIARIACFRDHIVAPKMADRAVQVPGGRPWHDRSGHFWLDPYDKRNWEYLASIVDYAMDVGFPEIQLDYVRFPSEGKSSTQVFPNKGKYPDKAAHPDDVITSFAKWMGERVRAHGCTFSADVFGIISEGKKDQGIGQTLEKIAAPFDVLSPMVYPSHFAKGEYGIADPNRSPYEIIKKSLGDYKRRIPTAKIRPWLQDFSLFHVAYGPKEVLAQVKASHDVGYDDFLLWDARNLYKGGSSLTDKAVEFGKVATPSAKPPIVPASRP